MNKNMNINPTSDQLHALWNLPPNVSNAVLDFLGEVLNAKLQPEDATVILATLERIMFKEWNTEVPLLAIVKEARP